MFMAFAAGSLTTAASPLPLDAFASSPLSPQAVSVLASASIRGFSGGVRAVPDLSTSPTWQLPAAWASASPADPPDIFKSKRAMSLWPSSAAMASSWEASPPLMVAPAFNSERAAPKLPLRYSLQRSGAKLHDALPMSAPASNNSAATSAWPFVHAQ